MRDAGLQCIEAIIQGQQSVPPEGNDDDLLFDAENCRMWFFRSHRRVLHTVALAPLGDRLDVDAQFPAQRRVRSFRSLYESSDCVRGLGAPVKNLPHSASFVWSQISRPPHAGTKHLAFKPRTAFRVEEMKV